MRGLGGVEFWAKRKISFSSVIVFRGGWNRNLLDRFQAHVEGVNKETENNNAVVVQMMERYI